MPLALFGGICAVRALGTFRSNDADDNENVKKTIGLISKTTTSHVHHTFLYISFPFLHNYDVKMPHFAFYRGRKQATTKFISLSELEYCPWNSASGGFAYNWQSKWIIALKTERMQIHFLSDVLVAVPSLDLKVPIVPCSTPACALTETSNENSKINTDHECRPRVYK